MGAAGVLREGGPDAREDELVVCARVYRETGAMAAGGWGFEMPLGVEIVWRAHMLSPLRYAQRGKSGDESSAVEMVAAVRRQQGFMKTLLEYERVGLVSGESVHKAVGEYSAFLKRAGEEGEVGEEPTAMVDLVWHAHQQFADRYWGDCVRIAGRFVDHIDDVGESGGGRLEGEQPVVH